MITREELMPAMLDVCPSFTSAWEEFNKEAGNEADDVPHVAMGALAQHLVSMFESGITESFPHIFELIERWLEEGSNDVQDLVGVGLLESIQNISLKKGIDLDAFTPYLRERTLQSWNNIIAAWNSR